MYVLPAALAPLAAYRQFVLVRLSQAYAENGTRIDGKSQKYPAWPHDTPTQSTMRDGTVVPVQKWSNFNAHDPSCWLDWQSAAQLAAVGPVGGDTLGWTIGFVLTENDPFNCRDLDSCVTLQGEWNEDAKTAMARMPGAMELSTSGQGMHIWNWSRGPVPPHGKRHKATKSEFYTSKRFIALGTTATGAMRDVTDELPGFIAEYFPPHLNFENDDEAWTDGPVADHTPLTDDELIHKAMSRSRPQGPEVIFGGGAVRPSFADLWTRNVDVLARAYPPQSPGKDFDYSDADCGLAKELAYWTGKDCERIRTLMERSALARDKWKVSNHRTYLRDTVLRGVGFCTAVYKEKPIVAPQLAQGSRLAPRAIEHQTFIGRESLAVLFADCVYIRDNNAVLLPNGDIVDQPRFNNTYAGYTYGMDNLNDKHTKHAWEAFLQNQLIAFPRADGTEFNPRMGFQDVVTRGGRTWVNVYKKPDVDRQQGDVSPFMDLLRRLFPNGDDAVILLSYMAALVQHPGVKFRWAPFIQGTMGNGKSTIVQCLRHALGHKYVFAVKAGMIENGFNAWLENNVLYVADDIYSSKDRTDMMEALKSLITETDHAITYKGVDSVQKRICGNFIFTDNHKDAMQKRDGTRRICTLYCAQQSDSDRRRDGLTKEYFAKTLYPWLENGGYAMVADMLHTMEIDARFNPAGDCQEAPETSMTREAIVDGRTGIEHEIAEMIELEEPGYVGNFVSVTMLKKDFGEKYKNSMGPLKIKEVMGRLGYEMHRYLPNGRLTRHVQQPDNKRSQVFVRCDSWEANMTDAELVTSLYVAAQNDALTAQTRRVMGV